MTETFIDPVAPGAARDAGLAARLESLALAGDDDGTFLRILAHAPRYAEALWDAMSEALMEGGVDHTLKELIRIRLARTAGDPYFARIRSRKAVRAGMTEDDVEAACGDFAHDPRFGDAQRWALRYAHLMYRHPEQVDADFYDEGKRHFTEAQIMELGGLIAVHYGMQMFMRTLQPSGSAPADPGA
ncbi:MAG TPA: carboxymuconolactone decarboxylase family protein [Euzebyales bacterium]|nr:carboxymuconolactone decarboxylase family protein [Euzebyales bacterium]